MTGHSARATPALQALTEADPALAALSLWCAHRDMAAGLAETRGDTIHYGPGFARLPLHQSIGLAGHHILHVALRHSARMAAMRNRLGERFDAGLWGIAADALVNEAVLQAGHALPRPALRLAGLLAAVPGLGGGLADWDVERLYLRLAQAAVGADDAARAHAAAQGHAPDLHPADDGAIGQAADDWPGHLARAMQAGRMAGRGIGALGRGLGDLPLPRLPWEVLLRAALARALIARRAPQPLRPARRWIAQADDAARRGLPDPGFVPGATRLAAAPRLVLALDMSGSVGDAQMALLLAEVGGAAARAAAEVWLVPFDDTADAPLRLPPGPLRADRLPLRKGGGTSLAPPLAAAARLGPSLAVVLTDLQADLPAPPRFPVLWAVPDDTGLPPPPWGQVISLAR
jgi:predicted metal-dependent peptidase